MQEPVAASCNLETQCCVPLIRKDKMNIHSIVILFHCAGAITAVQHSPRWKRSKWLQAQRCSWENYKSIIYNIFSNSIMFCLLIWGCTFWNKNELSNIKWGEYSGCKPSTLTHTDKKCHMTSSTWCCVFVMKLSMAGPCLRTLLDGQRFKTTLTITVTSNRSTLHT